MEPHAVAQDDENPGATAEVVVQVLPRAKREPQHRLTRVKRALYGVERCKRHHGGIGGGHISVAELGSLQLQQLQLIQERAPRGVRQFRSEEAALPVADASRELLPARAAIIVVSSARDAGEGQMLEQHAGAQTFAHFEGSLHLRRFRLQQPASQPVVVARPGVEQRRARSIVPLPGP